MILAPVLYSIAFSFSCMAPLLFISLVPLLISLERARGIGQSILRGAVFGALAAAGITWWIVTAAHFQYGISLIQSLLLFLLIAVIPMALLYMVFAAGYYYMFRQNRHRWLVLAGVPSLWIACDFCISLLPFGVPWTFAGYASAPMKWFIQAADIGGVYLLNFLIVAINTSIFMVSNELCKTGKCNQVSYKKTLLPMLSLLLIILVVFVYGLYSKGQWALPKEDTTSTVRVVIVQGNFTSRERWQDDSIYQRLEVYRGMTESVTGRNGATLVVWPETVMNSSRVSHDEFASDMLNTLGEKTVIITGAVAGRKGRKVYNSAYAEQQDSPL